MTFRFHLLLATYVLTAASIGCLSAQNSTVTDTLSRVKQLDEVVVHGTGAERNLNAPEMGRISLDSKAILSIPTFLGEPDVIKSLQIQPGVSQGIEGFAGLFVRGGDGDQNLFRFQGLPLYHVSHLGGIFSAFNVATVSQVDFYKASFPAQFGGRISSITDVAMCRPDFESYHGRFSVGLLSANVFITGPIAKHRTAFVIGARRSWMEILSIPTLAIMNSIDKKNGKKHIGTFNFMDFNARIDHIFSSIASAHIVGYYGHDYLKIGQREFEAKTKVVKHYGNNPPVITIQEGTPFFDEDINRMSWGNWGIIGTFNLHLGPGQWSTSAYYSDYTSSYLQQREFQSDMKQSETYGFNMSETRNSISDAGIESSYFADFGRIYRMRIGALYVRHNYLPEGLQNQFISADNSSINCNGNPRTSSNEYAAYIDNTFTLNDRIAISAGLRGTHFNIEGHTFKNLEPRAAIKMSVTSDYSIKLGYARMNQYVQQISSNYINLPTDLWQPITPQFKPLRSDQYSLGVYGNLPWWSIFFSVEGWYKDMKNLLEYREGVTVLDPDIAWEDKLTAGKGWAYGVDFSFTRDVGRLTGTVGYGLLWNWRKFDNLNHGLKFPSKFDNRHKLNINLSYKLSERCELNAGWTFMTGNRLTLSIYNYDIPGSQFPEAPTVGNPGWGNENQGISYYSSRNNVRIPAYHRLDLGISLYKNYRNGRRGTWTFGIYNAYCRMNPITVKKDEENNVLDYNGQLDKWHRAFKSLSFIPLIPSASYTYTF